MLVPVHFQTWKGFLLTGISKSYCYRTLPHQGLALPRHCRVSSDLQFLDSCRKKFKM